MAKHVDISTVRHNLTDVHSLGNYFAELFVPLEPWGLLTVAAEVLHSENFEEAKCSGLLAGSGFNSKICGFLREILF